MINPPELPIQSSSKRSTYCKHRRATVLAQKNETGSQWVSAFFPSLLLCQRVLAKLYYF